MYLRLSFSFYTGTACISAQVYSEELCVVIESKVVIRRIRGDVILGHQSDVKLESSIFLVYYVKHLL